MLLEHINLNHRCCFNFFYLPIDVKNNCNVGYAFINMTDPIFVLTLYEEFNGRYWEHFNSEKICELTYGRIQGKEGLVENFLNSVETRKVKPLIINNLSLENQSKADALRAYYSNRYFGVV